MYIPLDITLVSCEGYHQSVRFSRGHRQTLLSTYSRPQALTVAKVKYVGYFHVALMIVVEWFLFCVDGCVILFCNSDIAKWHLRVDQLSPMLPP